MADIPMASREPVPLLQWSRLSFSPSCDLREAFEVILENDVKGLIVGEMYSGICFLEAILSPRRAT
jgi:hypothetical protein